VVLSQRTDAGANVDLVESMRHQLAHVALFDAAAGRALPRWLQEGFAFEVSGEAALRRVQALASAKARGKLATIDRLEVFPVSEPDLRVAVAESADFVHYLSHGEQRAPFAATIARVRNGEPLPVAIDAAYGRDLRALETAWRDDLAHRYVTVPLVATGAAGWSLAIGVWALRRRKKKRAETETLDAELMPPELPEPAAPRSSSRLLVCDRGVGHVVYIVAGKGVPKVEHDGKRHTLH
jgi:hypothetical protein